MKPSSHEISLPESEAAASTWEGTEFAVALQCKAQSDQSKSSPVKGALERGVLEGTCDSLV